MILSPRDARILSGHERDAKDETLKENKENRRKSQYRTIVSPRVISEAAAFQEMTGRDAGGGTFPTLGSGTEEQMREGQEVREGGVMTDCTFALQSTFAMAQRQEHRQTHKASRGKSGPVPSGRFVLKRERCVHKRHTTFIVFAIVLVSICNTSIEFDFCCCSWKQKP
jgi:hypothetical protein